ncbi:sodium-dependent transporter [Duncaniella freteri]|jgi:NSS family neurotransmitter:Na+ symporter|uniref:sodium-dependent transporter n=1 Tax=Duncaniella freteri TaxID=2530391 RepID=UPI00256F1E1A|nr:sodium-dependent transporter [Duncaniella freteri]
MNNGQRTQFATRLGVIATTVGSAVGLGNIWRFPYEAGVHGGGAFLLIDLFFIFIIGVPVVCAEFIIGRRTGSNIRGAFRSLSPGKAWGWVSYIGITASILILSFYSVVAGWTLEYTIRSISGFGGATTPEGLHDQFDAYASSDIGPVVWTMIFLAVNYVILVRGVQKGIEKMSNILMPMLFVILIIFVANSLMMPGAAEGLKFLFMPDFSQVTPSVVLSAMGQAFFSLSLGHGCLITYSSYFTKGTPLVRTALITAGLDTFVAILAGVIIFPAVFTFGQEPAAGPKLVFEVLPSIFMHIGGGVFWSTLFFFLLFLASITSTISMAEISIAYFAEEFGMSRRASTALTIGIAMILGTLCALSFGSLNWLKAFGMTIFNFFDYFSSNILLPVGGMIISLFVGWVLDRGIIRGELINSHGRSSVSVSIIVFCLRWLAPLCIGLVFIFGLGIF